MNPEEKKNQYIIFTKIICLKKRQEDCQNLMILPLRELGLKVVMGPATVSYV